MIIIRYNNYTKDSCFSIGLQRIGEEDAEQVKEIIQKTFETVAEYVHYFITCKILMSFAIRHSPKTDCVLLLLLLELSLFVFREGFSETRVKAVLHQIEMGLKHQSSNFGLSLMLVRE